jgi:hypothetical protein
MEEPIYAPDWKGPRDNPSCPSPPRRIRSFSVDDGRVHERFQLSAEIEGPRRD